jgi:phage repressor protein C with HTH and peptisase S24 domain
MAKVLAHRSAKRVELHSVNPDFAMRSLPSEDIAWIARIVWASQ